MAPKPLGLTRKHLAEQEGKSSKSAAQQKSWPKFSPIRVKRAAAEGRSLPEVISISRSIHWCGSIEPVVFQPAHLD